jgi:hypothetical protein
LTVDVSSGCDIVIFVVNSGLIVLETSGCDCFCKQGFWLFLKPLVVLDILSGFDCVEN